MTTTPSDLRERVRAICCPSGYHKPEYQDFRVASCRCPEVEALVAAEREDERRRCAGDKCHWCRVSIPVFRAEPEWMHRDERGEDYCRASAIHERAYQEKEKK